MSAMRFLLLPPVCMLMFVGLMYGLHRAAPLASLIPQPVNWAGVAIMVVGLGMARSHARLFKRIGTNINTFGEPGSLVTAGLFARTRNPMYLGMIVCLVGVAFVLGSLSPLIGPLGFFLLANRWYVPLEEKAMAKKFRSEYADYKQSVPRWL